MAFDWGSLAANILPAAAGALMGGGAGGMGVLPGALYGAGHGARASIDSEMQREMANREIAFKNQRLQHDQQRIDLDARRQQQDEERFGAERERWALQDRVAEQQMQMRDLEMQRAKMQITEAQRSQEARANLRAGLASDEERNLFDVDPEGWLKRKDQELRLQGAGRVLGQFGLQNGDEIARVLGPQGTSSLLGSIIESRNRPRERYGFHYDATSGMGFSYDKTTGAMRSQQIGEPRVPAEKRTAIENSLLKRWKEQNPPLARMAEEAGDWSAYDEWRASPVGRIEAAFLGGEIDFSTAQGYRESFARQERELEALATEEIKKAYMGAGKSQTEAGFQTYLASPDGQQNFQAYKRAIRQRGRKPLTPQQPQQAATPAPQASAAPKKEEPKKPAPAASASAKESLLKDFGL